MKALHAEIYNMLDTLPDAIVAVCNETITYMNPVAKELIGEKLIDTPAKNTFDDLLLEHGSGVMSSFISIRNESYAVTVSSVDELRVFTIHRDNRNYDEENGMVKSAVPVMRNSLAVCRSSVELLRGKVQEKGDIKSVQYISMLDKACHSLVRTVGNMAFLTGADGDGEALNESVIDIVELCVNVIDTVKILPSESKITITCDSNDDRILYYGDGKKIERMLLGLISNSIKYTGNGGKINVSVNKNAQGVVISVRDNGCGVPAKAMSRVFHSYSGERDITDIHSGAGFGLAVSQKIARLHGGTLIIDSKTGVGTNVTVMLPQRNITETILHEPKSEYRNDMSAFLSELADVIEYSAYYGSFEE